MGLMQSKNQQSGLNRCACICNTVDHYKICVTQPVSSSPTPYRTTVFSGNPYYSKVNQQVTGKRWFSLDSTKMSNRQLSGSDLLKDNRQNKDLSFTMRERDQYKIRGLLPAAIRGQKLEAEAAMAYLNSLESNLTKYMFLRELQDRNERLFYRVLCENTEQLMPLVYTPVVGEACINYSRIFQRARGMYITVHDSGQISNILANWPEKDVKAIVVTDGERILGLGDLGANGMGIPVGKLSLYTALAGIPPNLTLPVTLDTGTDNQELLNNPFYIGLKQRRVRGPQYDDLIDEFMEAVIKRWGRSCLIQFEDFGNRNAFRLLEKYRDNYCTFNDDIQGTASVCVAGILASCRITGMRISQQKFLFFGAGEAALGIANLLVMAMEKEGVPNEEARDRIWLMDSRGLVVENREGGLDNEKIKFAKKAEPMKNLEAIVDLVKPTALIGVAAQPKAFNEKILKKMGALSDRPLIFPLSNPTSKAECTADEAYHATEGRCVFASGSPFDAVEINGKTFHPGQGNNAYIFPGISLAAIACGVHTIPDESFLIASKALADQVTDEDLAQGRVYPPLSDIREVSLKLAAKVAQYFYVESLATVRPEPTDKLLFMKTLQYDYSYV
ncbi:NADP-dependent malic enzyme isoform X1 [Tetranychus urticae]|uniref:Malic enzyme n=1 Tax=Tetranychus urticae TaxID=32264 RepID=T1KCR8_TETUR|nr:NADP-dependent malic enzyme isoform X1 [Tetranychus urticae]